MMRPRWQWMLPTIFNYHFPKLESWRIKCNSVNSLKLGIPGTTKRRCPQLTSVHCSLTSMCPLMLALQVLLRFFVKQSHATVSIHVHVTFHQNSMFSFSASFCLETYDVYQNNISYMKPRQYLPESSHSYSHLTLSGQCMVYRMVDLQST